MDPASNEYAEAKKRWQQRNTDGRFCYDEFGKLERCWNPPRFTFTDVSMPPGISDGWPSDAEYEPHPVVVEHVWDARAFVSRIARGVRFFGWRSVLRGSWR
jgi:hypothetical protein